MLRPKGIHILPLVLIMLLTSGVALAEEVRYAHGNAEIRETPPSTGCAGRDLVLIDQKEHCVCKRPWLVQDHWLEPAQIFLPEFPLQKGSEPCLVYWEVYVPEGRHAVWHISYEGEVRQEDGVWRIRYYATATLHAATA
jgi:hypothetical protein